MVWQAGLKWFDEGASSLGTMQRFQWVSPNQVARSSQPGYTGHDGPHKFQANDIQLLSVKGIQNIISANSLPLHAIHRTSLTNAGINYYHCPVEDFHPATFAQLINVAGIINSGPTLVYCGYGQGRTGTYIAGWAISTGRIKKVDGAYLREVFGVETDEQIGRLQGLV